MKEKIISWCRQQNIKVAQLTPYQTRLSITNIIVTDVYWRNRRFHIIRHPITEMVQVRGDIGDEIIFLESVFSNI